MLMTHISKQKNRRKHHDDHIMMSMSHSCLSKGKDLNWRGVKNSPCTVATQATAFGLVALGGGTLIPYRMFRSWLNPRAFTNSSCGSLHTAEASA